jgi:hypothetical protein
VVGIAEPLSGLPACLPGHRISHTLPPPRHGTTPHSRAYPARGGVVSQVSLKKRTNADYQIAGARVLTVVSVIPPVPTQRGGHSHHHPSSRRVVFNP